MSRLSLANFLGIRKSAPKGKKSIMIDPSDMSLAVTGYTASEVRDLLAVYREHQYEMIEILKVVRLADQTARSAGDAVRYVPQTPEDVMGEHR